MVQLAKYNVVLNFGILKIEGDWEPNKAEIKAAWELYVELITRITVVNLGDDKGTIRESLNSLYSLFQTTRGILREYGPDIAKSGTISLGYIAVSALNGSIRPFLSKWHPLLEEYEESKPAGKSSVTYEKEWEYANEVRKELKKLREQMQKYADQLAIICKVDALHNYK